MKLSDAANNPPPTTPTTHNHHHQQQSNSTFFSPANISVSSDLSASSNQSGGNLGLNSLNGLLDDGKFEESFTHPKSFSIPSKLCSNYSQITFYDSKGIYNSEVEDAIQSMNETSSTKVSCGVDVVYQTAKRL